MIRLPGLHSRMARCAVVLAGCAALLLLAYWLVTGLGGGTLNVQVDPGMSSGYFRGGSRVLLVKAQVASDLRNSLSWWDDRLISQIVLKWAREKIEVKPGTIVTEPDLKERQRYCRIVGQFKDRNDEVLVISSMGDCALESLPDVAGWCSYWIACYRDETLKHRKVSDENGLLEHYLADTSRTLKNLIERDQGLMKLSEELEDRETSEALRRDSEECTKWLMAAGIKADTYRGISRREREVSDGFRKKCRHFGKVREAVSSGCTVEKFLSLTELDETTSSFLKKLSASKTIRTIADLSSWLNATVDRMHAPFAANLAAEATLDSGGRCTFRQVPAGDYYVIIPSIRLGERRFIVCRALSMKGGTRHMIIDGRYFYAEADWGVLRRIFQPFIPDFIKKTAIDDTAPEDIESLLKKNLLMINSRDVRGLTALHYAARKGNPGIAGIFLSQGADPNVPDNDLQTPLHCAIISASRNSAEANFLDVVKMLLEKRADINKRDGSNLTVLHYAVAYRCHPVMLELLLKSGADVQAPDDGGDTPLHYAARGGSPDMISLLLRYGAKRECQNKNGETAMDVARLFSHRLAVAILKEKKQNKRRTSP